MSITIRVAMLYRQPRIDMRPFTILGSSLYERTDDLKRLQKRKIMSDINEWNKLHSATRLEMQMRQNKLAKDRQK